MVSLPTRNLRAPSPATLLVSSSRRRPIGVDLFAGAGGLSLGFERAGFDIAAAVELDPIHCATHEFNFPYCTPICRDVADIDGAEIRRQAGLFNKDIAVVFGGAPCQGFSVIGKRALDDPRNALVHHFVRLVTELQPAYFAFENVSGLAVGKQRGVLDEMINAFDPDYQVLLPYQVLNAADYGVPQNRRRLFLLGARRDHALPQYPPPNPERVTVAAALADLPEADDFRELLGRDWVVAPHGTPSAYAQTLRGELADPADYSYRRVSCPLVLTSSLRTNHTPISRIRFANTARGKTEPISRLYRLNPQTQANAIRAGTASDHGALTSPRPIHPDSPRVITNREAARLHSYPDWFRFHVTKWHGFRQIGNSVPPLLAHAIAAQTMGALAQEPFPPVPLLSRGNPDLLALSMVQAARRYGVPPDVIPRRRRRSNRLPSEDAFSGPPEARPRVRTSRTSNRSQVIA